MVVDIEVTKNFQHLLENKDKRIVILSGSSRSGKTYATCQYILSYCLTNKNKIITVARDNLVVNKRTVFLDFVEILTFSQISYTLNKSEMIIKIGTNIVRFVGLDDIQKIHGLKQDLCYVNEGLNIEQAKYLQLLQRTSEQMIIDFNPSRLKHFLYDWGDFRDDTILFNTNIFDNHLAPKEVVKQILSYEPTEANIIQGTANEFMWQVYGLGNRFKGSDVVIREFKRYTQELDPNEIEWEYYGGDFGFTDPTTLTRVQKIKGANKLFCRVFLYKKGMTNPQIAEYMKKHPEIDENAVQIWDSAEPKSIVELRTNGINAIKARKGVGSIYFGIQKMQQFEIFVYKDALSEHLARELENLRFETDSEGDILKNRMNQPILVSGGDHCVDGVRYVLEKFNN